MEILIVAAELSPYTKAGEAGESIASLSRMLAQLGHAVTIALPRYASFEAQGLLVARRLTPLRLASGDPVTVFDGQLGSGVKLALFDAPDLYTRDGVYGEDGKEYPDNARRFGLLAQAATALAARRAADDQPFDVAHLHDWPGALTAVLLAQAEIPLPKVLTLHDVERTGSFAQKDLEALGIAPEHFTEAGVKLGSRVNVLKGGVLMADFLTTVSPTYALDLMQPERGGALASVIASRADELVGIVNGLVRPLAFIVTFPLTVITLGLFLLVLNAAMLALVALIVPGFHLEGFWTAVGAGLLVSLVSWAASSMIGTKGRIEVFVRR